MLEKRHQVPELNRVPVGQVLLGGPRDEFVEQRCVGFLCMLGLPAFVPQVLEEIFDERLHCARS